MSLPQGGGAVQPTGETLRNNAVTGTGSFSVPVALSPGRSGLGPKLSLSYDSGSGNGPFGHGWSVGISSVRRRTSKGLPQYDDAVAGRTESDVFVLAGAEDLVPMRDELGVVITRSQTAMIQSVSVAFTVQRFRPRVQGAFARVERWRRDDDGTVHWRTRDADNVLRMYGHDPAGERNSRVVDPDDASRVFEWLLEEERDEVGNLVQTTYAVENRVGVASHPAEHARLQPGSACTHHYPKRIRYGNRTPSVANNWPFELVFDYGEHTSDPPTAVKDGVWPVRSDPFSTFRPGFDPRCYRLCHRILMFHDFAEVGGSTLVRSTDLRYVQAPHLTKLMGVTHRGYRTESGTATSLAMPEVSFEYLEPELGQDVELVRGFDDVSPSFQIGEWQWVDLDGEGLTGLLTERAGARYYRRNEGDGELGPIQVLRERPSAGLEGGQLMDLDGDGRLELVSFRGPLQGDFDRGDDGRWEGFSGFDTPTDAEPGDPNVRLLDIDGDGLADLVLTEENRLAWFKSRGRQGFDAPRYMPKGYDEQLGPTLVLQSDPESLFLADMTGDGLTDLVQVRYGSICYPASC